MSLGQYQMKMLKYQSDMVSKNSRFSGFWRTWRVDPLIIIQESAS
jgi:hypothetical protein